MRAKPTSDAIRITIPYEELGEITAVKRDGSRIPIIKDSRFVLPGTEELNRVLDE